MSSYTDSRHQKPPPPSVAISCSAMFPIYPVAAGTVRQPVPCDSRSRPGGSWLQAAKNLFQRQANRAGGQRFGFHFLQTARFKRKRLTAWEVDHPDMRHSEGAVFVKLFEHLAHLVASRKNFDCDQR